MKLYLMTLLVLSSFLTYKAQGIKTGRVDLSASNRQDIVKILPMKGSVQLDDLLLAKKAKFSSGLNRKLMTQIPSSSTTTSDSENQKNKHDPKPQVKSTHDHELVEKEDSLLENSKTKDVNADPDVTDIGEMDYTPARKKSPIHN
ncbi:hypothetical protein R6Q57_029153 [Mikania cordata]